MAMRNLTFALAAATMTTGASAQAAVPVSAPARSGASLEDPNHLGGAEIAAVAVFMLAILAIMIFDGDGDDGPASP